ncbi:MAG: hypothetical protein H8E98_05310 [Bacteroidetes bacterium]|nr:hypothetical protein [Bacteroidota bacterium]
MKIKEELIRLVLTNITTSLEELSEKTIRAEIEKNIIIDLIDIIPHKDNTLLYKKYTITFYECDQLIHEIDYIMRVKELIDIKII